MFPLGSVLVPHAPLPLHVFEPRYRALVDDVLAGDGTFGVVLIERGHEVGGGDTRFDIACRARIVESEQTADGRWGLLCTGTDRLRVERWLPDAPYPVAEVDVLDDGAWTPDARMAMERAISAFREVIDLATELGATVDPEILSLTSDPLTDHWLLVGRAPIADLDKLRILAADTPERRLDVLADELAGVATVLASRRDGG
jgi:Lon protease-like protein